MNLVLFTSSDCGICKEAEKVFREVYAEELKSGEADVVDIEKDEQAQQIWAENGLEVAPTMIVISDSLKVITEMDPEEMIKELKEQEAKKEPAAAH